MKRDVLGPWPLGDTGVVCGENIRTTLLKRQGSSFSSCTRCSRQQQGYYGQYSGFSSAPISSRSSQKETLKLPPFFLWQKQLNILLWIATLNFCPDHLTRSVYNSTSIVMVLSLVPTQALTYSYSHTNTYQHHTYVVADLVPLTKSSRSISL